MMRALFRAAFVGVLALGLVSCKSTKWKDVKQWERLGQHWAVGKSATGESLAIYDLGYPKIGVRFNLGKLEIKKNDINHILKTISNGLKDPKLLTKFTVQEIARLGGIRIDRFPPKIFDSKWWSKVKWTEFEIQTNSVAPQEFNLASIDWVGMGNSFIDRVKIKQALYDLKKQAKEFSEDGLFSHDPLAQFSFRMTQEGGYVVEWEADATIATEGQISSEAFFNRPTKIADFQNIKNTLYKALAWDGFRKAVGRLARLIKVPVASALLKTAVNRFFYYYGSIRKARRDILMDSVEAVERQYSNYSPLTRFSYEERNVIAISQVFGGSTIFDSFSYLFLNAQQIWDERLQSNYRNDLSARKWLENNQFSTFRLGPHYLLGNNSNGEKYLFASAAKNISDGGDPQILIDYQNSDQIRSHRLKTDVLGAGFIFATYMIPIRIVPGLLRRAYGYFFQSSIYRARNWDARLIGHLEQRRFLASENFDEELEILYPQLANPFDLEREKSLELILDRAKLIGVQ